MGTISHDTLRNDLQWWVCLWGKDDPNFLITPPNIGQSNDPHERFWVLGDVLLDVKKGDFK